MAICCKVLQGHACRPTNSFLGKEAGGKEICPGELHLDGHGQDAIPGLQRSKREAACQRQELAVVPETRKEEEEEREEET